MTTMRERLFGRFRSLLSPHMRRADTAVFALLLAFALPLAGSLAALGRTPACRWETVRTLPCAGSIRQILCGQGYAAQSVVYTASADWGIYASLDGGQTWLPANHRLEHGALGDVRIGTLAMAPDNPLSLIVAVPGSALNGRPGIYRTTDGGEVWLLRRGGIGERDLEAVAMGEYGLAYAVSGRDLYRSTDGGDNWEQTGNRPSDSAVLAMAVEPETGTLLLGTRQDGLWLTHDHGATWSTALAGLTVHALALAPGGRLYAGGDYGLYISQDHGASWQVLAPQAKARPIVALAIRAGATDAILCAPQGQPLRYSADGGATWQALETTLLTAPITALAVDPNTPDAFYVGTERGLWRVVVAK